MKNAQYCQLNNKREIPFIHPGIILNKEILKKRRISQKKIASATNIPYETVKKICQGKKDIDKNIGGELSSYFQINKDFWINLQTRYNLVNQKEDEKEKSKSIVINRVSSLNPYARIFLVSKSKYK